MTWDSVDKTPLSLAFAEQNQCTKLIIITINSKALESENISGSWAWWLKKSSIDYTILNKKTTDFKSDRNEALIINYESLFDRAKSRASQFRLKENVMSFINSSSNHKVAVIVDESHKMKDIHSLQTKSINRIQVELKFRATKVYSYLLTGTPFTTGYIDLYSQLKFLGYSQTKNTFVDEYCVKGRIPGLLEWQQPIVGYKNLNQLYSEIHKFAITIKSEDVVDLPEKIFVKHIDKCSKSFVDFTTDKPKNPYYRNIDYPNTDWIAETVGNFWLRCRQLSIGFQGNSEKSKWFDQTRLKSFEKFISENPDNYVIFYNYTPELLALYDICEKEGYKVDVYSGEIKSLFFYEQYQKQSEEQKLTNNKNIILANFASGSTGMNWQEYSKCIIFSLPLYKDYEQGLKRINRLGQKQTTIYHLFYQNNWLDKSMLKSLEEKTDYSVKMFESDLKQINDLQTN